MALNQLSEKLDQLDARELGIEFDEMATWSRLEQRLDEQKAFVYRWFAAACILVGLVLLPISVLKETTVETVGMADQVEELPAIIEPTQPIVVGNGEPTKPLIELRTLAKKIPGTVQLAEIQNIQLILEPIPVQENIEIKSAFAAEDISMIQASLERSSIEKGKRITVRAQLQSFPDQAKSNQKVLKIKLYEKH